MYRFFISRESIDEAAGTIQIQGEDVGHIHSVLRMKPGEEVLLCTGMEGDQTDYLCRIEGYSDGAVLTKIVSKNRSQQELPSRLYLFQGLPKADKLESIIQKSVELGVYRIVPTLMKRCVVKPDTKKIAKKTARWNAIALAAAKQSKRGIVPEVTEPVSFLEALELTRSLDHVVVPYENSDGIEHTRVVLSSVKPGESCGIFIGPEGGFDENEINMLRDIGGAIVTLGHRILRTETAGPAVLAALMLHLEE
ncbi:RsmE family RNA methyltransferase [Porcincola sp. LCP21S3_C12]|jgi:16S rRNA (uracil1498-N3)-methyltransferase|uniref:RsmE family RNA methyltransferase n=1 Tax=Porcincola sp. LCP21S3_C12 TaxID=3438798 RepID=UPI003F9C6511